MARFGEQCWVSKEFAVADLGADGDMTLCLDKLRQYGTILT